MPRIRLLPVRAAVTAAIVVLSGCASAPEDGPLPSAAPAFVPAAPAAETAPAAPADRAGSVRLQRGAIYPLQTCVVDQQPLGAGAVEFTAGGRTFRTCGEACRAAVAADPFAFTHALDRATIAEQLPHYPLATCPVSGRPLGSQGPAVDLVLDGTLVRFCCRLCTRKGADAAQLVQKVRTAAQNRQVLDYPLTRCIVSGRPLGEQAITTMFGTQMVKFCCPKCADAFAADPHHWLPRLATATATDWTAVAAPVLPTCIVTGKDLGPDAVTFTANDRLWSTCSPQCRLRVEGNMLGYAEKLDRELMRRGRETYPLATCPVSGEPLGTMGEPVELLFDGTLVKLCCDKCAAKAQARTAAIVRKVRQAAFEQQQQDYPLVTCPISGEPLGDTAVSAMVGTTLVRLCCERCVEQLRQHPGPALRAVAAARATAAAQPCCTETKDAGSCCCGGGTK